MAILDDKECPDAPGEGPVESGAHGRALFEGMGDACAFYRMVYQDGAPVDWVYLAVNPAFERLTGLKDVIGRRISEFFPGVRDSSADLFEICARVAGTGQTEEGESYVSALGRWLSFQVFSSGPGQFAAIFKDITAHKQALEAARLNEQRFRLLFELSPDPSSLSSADGTLLMVNQAWCDLTGVPRGEAIGSDPAALGSWSRSGERQNLLGDLSRAGMAVTRESMLRRRDGGERQMLVTAKMLAIGEQQEVLMLGKDVTEFHELSKALGQSEARFRRLITDLPVGVLIHSDKGEVLFCNGKALDILGLEESQLMGRTALDPDWKIIHEDGSAFTDPACPARLAVITGGPVHDVVMGISHPGAREPVWVSVHAEPQLDEAGAVRQVITTFLDITPRKAAEAEQAQMQRRLHQAQRMESLGILVAGVAHTMNNVLAVIMGTASWREPSVTDPADLEAYQRISRACVRGRDVVKSLMQFSRPSLAAPAPFELDALVREVCPLVENASRSPTRIAAAGDGEPLWVLGDAASVKLALVNLCFNALEAMPDGGTLTLRCTGRGADWAEVAVEDDGRGMAPEVLAHAAEPFFTTKDGSTGAGLGLSMVYGVTAAHGGTMGITSQAGLGTTVVLQFPRILAPAPVENGRGPAPSLRLRKVLLVDDEEDVRLLMQRMLSKAGVALVETAAGGEAALACLDAGDLPDVIILDQNMPGMTGVEFLARVRERHPELPVLISSGQPDIEEWPDFQGARVGVISKPFTLLEIQTKLEAFARELGLPGEG